MEDLNALAVRLAAGVGDVRGCLIVSRDGLVLGAHPEDGEAQLKPAWLRFAAVGEPDRSFVQFGDEIWCYVRRGAYAAFLVTSVGVRPGFAIDQIEQVLLTAEEGRSKREATKVPEAPAAPSGKPRTPLHAEPSRVDDPVLIHSETPAVAETFAPTVQRPSAARAPTPAAEAPPSESTSESERVFAFEPETEAASGFASEPETTSKPRSRSEVASESTSKADPETKSDLAAASAAASGTPTALNGQVGPNEREPDAPTAPEPDAPAARPVARERSSGGIWGRRKGDVQEDASDDDVDRVLLAREFSQLLQEDQKGADG